MLASLSITMDQGKGSEDAVEKVARNTQNVLKDNRDSDI